MYRADLFTKQLGPVSAAGRTLVERILPQELAEGEFALNHASREFLNLRVDGNASPREGESKDGRTCACSRRMKRVSLTPGQAYGEAARNAVFWASTYVWIEPEDRNTAWNQALRTPASTTTQARFSRKPEKLRAVRNTCSAQSRSIPTLTCASRRHSVERCKLPGESRTQRAAHRKIKVAVRALFPVGRSPLRQNEVGGSGGS